MITVPTQAATAAREAVKDARAFRLWLRASIPGCRPPTGKATRSASHVRQQPEAQSTATNGRRPPAVRSNHLGRRQSTSCCLTCRLCAVIQPKTSLGRASHAVGSPLIQPVTSHDLRVVIASQGGMESTRKVSIILFSVERNSSTDFGQAIARRK